MEGLFMGLLVGAGLAVVGKRFHRPAIKAAIKAGMRASEALSDAAHEGREQLLDLVAEARHEIETETARAAAAPPGEDPRGASN